MAAARLLVSHSVNAPPQTEQCRGPRFAGRLTTASRLHPRQQTRLVGKILRSAIERSKSVTYREIVAWIASK